jgi:uncharacterized spore protein YtfJ
MRTTLSLMDLKDLLTKASEHLSVSRAFGAAYEKDGSLIIPVAFVAGGGGGGGTDDPPSHRAHRDFDLDDEDDDDDLDEEEFEPIDREQRETPLGGSGGGFGGVVMPIGVYVVKDDQVRWVPALNMTFIAIAALGLARVLVRTSSKRHRRHH